jgi:hypothetical protein
VEDDGNRLAPEGFGGWTKVVDFVTDVTGGGSQGPRRIRLMV